MKLPTRVWSQIGPVRVEPKPTPPPSPDVNPDFGEWDAGARAITINTTAVPPMQIATLFHEMTHVAIWDAGGQNVLTEQQIEFVCDAVGSYLAGALLAGFVKLSVPKE